MSSIRTVFFIFTLLCLGWALLVGKDLSWDVVNHHLYLPFAWYEGRIDTDFFAAGPQSYQNPLGFFPFYFMVSWGWPSWLVGSALALVHSLNCVFIARIASVLWRDEVRRNGWIFLATLLAWLAPIFLFVIGSSTVDAIGSALVLASFMLLVDCRQSRSKLLLCGVLLALSFSVKQTNAVFILSAAGVMLWQWGGRRRSFGDLLFCAMGVFLGLLLGMGWFSWVLWEQFGNPIFPLYNNIFESPYAAHSAIVAGRFMTDGFDGLRFIDLALMKRFIYFEGFAPDIRFVALFGVGVLGFFVVAYRFLRGRMAGVSCWTPKDTDVLLFALLSYLLWLFTSGNGRYALPLFLLCGLLLVRWAYLVFSAPVARSLVLIIGVLQMGYTLSAADLRFSAEPWDSEPYLKVTMAERLKNEPFLHLALGIQTHASLATLFNPGGVLINPIGQMSLPRDASVLGRALEERLQQWRGRSRIVIAYFDRGDDKSLVQTEQRINEIIYRLNMSVDMSDCEEFSFSWNIAKPGSFFAMLHAKNLFLTTRTESRFLSCAVVDGTRLGPELEQSMLRADSVFSFIEKACPEIYGPPGFVSDRGVNDWRRFYPNTDASVLVSEKDGVVVQSPRSPNDRIIGSVEEVLSGDGYFDCSRWKLSTPD